MKDAKGRKPAGKSPFLKKAMPMPPPDPMMPPAVPPGLGVDPSAMPPAPGYKRGGKAKDHGGKAKDHDSASDGDHVDDGPRIKARMDRKAPSKK